MHRRRMGAVVKALRTCTGVDNTQEGLQQSRGRALISYRVLQRLNPLCACARGKMHAHGCCAFARTGDSSVSRRTTCAISSSSVSKKGTFFHETGERMRTQSCTCACVHTCTNTHTHLVYAHVRCIFPLERRSTAWLPVGDTIFVRADILLRSCSCAHLEGFPKHMSVDRRGFEIKMFGRMQTSCYRTAQSLCICVYVFHAIIHSCMHTFLVGGLDQPAGNERSPSQKWISMKWEVHAYALLCVRKYK